MLNGFSGDIYVFVTGAMPCTSTLPNFITSLERTQQNAQIMGLSGETIVAARHMDMRLVLLCDRADGTRCEPAIILDVALTAVAQLSPRMTALVRVGGFQEMVLIVLPAGRAMGLSMVVLINLINVGRPSIFRLGFDRCRVLVSMRISRQLSGPEIAPTIVAGDPTCQYESDTKHADVSLR